MADKDETCAHDACTCMATQGEYCSDYCREHSGDDNPECGCGHPECMAPKPSTP